MKRWYMAIALVAIIGMVALVEAGINGIDASGGDDAAGKMAKWRHMLGRLMARGHGRGMQMQQHAWQHVARHMLEITRVEGTLENVNGTYYINNTPLYFGDDAFLNMLARSDYDGDGVYEQIWEELEGLEGSHVVVNGMLNNGTLYVSHINGIWFRVPRDVDVVTIEGTLENINGSFYVDGYELKIKRGYSRSDIDGDGALERMYEEFAGLEGSDVTVDGVMHNGWIMVMHINGIWAR